MLILNHKDVLASLSMADAIIGMKQAFTALGTGQVEMPVRTHLPVQDVNAEWLIMPSYVGGESKALAVKCVGVFPENSKLGMPPILGLVNVADPKTGEPLAILEGASITGIRTAAVSGVATDWMARSDSRVLAVIGGGVQAKTHVEAMSCIRNIEEVRFFSRTRSKIERIVEEIRQSDWSPQTLNIVDSGDEAVRGADIVCCCTSASEPVFSNEAISPGTHINAVGLHSPEKREVPGEMVARAVVVVDQRKVALHAGDLQIPISSGLIDANHVVAELGELAADRDRVIRRDDTQITFFKSVGLAMEDAVAAQICLENANRLGLGTRVDW